MLKKIKWWGWVIIAIVALIGLLAIRNHNLNEKRKAQEAEQRRVEKENREKKANNRELTPYEEDQLFLIKQYGEPGEGYRWSDDGTRLALGDPNLSESEVAMTFLRSVSTLDFATAQKYAYKDAVLTTVNRYYNPDDAEFTYEETFEKNMYTEVLLSIEPLGIEKQATFADERANLAMRLKILDLTNKDFWKGDADEIFSNLETYSRSEQDTTKAKQYLYDYVLNYWRSEGASKREVQVNIVLTQTPEGGWMVTTDTDLDNHAKYVDGETVVNNILEEFDTYLDTLEE